jgi:hypothetical protein
MVMEVIPGNGLSSVLAAGIGTTDTVLSIAPGDAGRWPASGAYRAVLCVDPVNGPFELVRVTGGQGTSSLTVTRAAEVYNGDGLAHAWSTGTTISAVITQATLQLVLAGASPVHEEFKPAGSTNTVTLTQTPRTVLLVARAGVIQSEADAQYSVSHNVITFASAFTGSERVIVNYTWLDFAPVESAPDTELRTYIQHIMGSLDPGGPPPSP